jgi:hypothetical protein
MIEKAINAKITSIPELYTIVNPFSMFVTVTFSQLIHSNCSKSTLSLKILSILFFSQTISPNP